MLTEPPVRRGLLSLYDAVMRYEFECTACGKVEDFETRTPIDGHPLFHDAEEQVPVLTGQCGCGCHRSDSVKHCAPCCYPGQPVICFGRWKRRWSFAIAWPTASRGH